MISPTLARELLTLSATTNEEARTITIHGFSQLPDDRKEVWRKFCADVWPGWMICEK